MPLSSQKTIFASRGGWLAALLLASCLPVHAQPSGGPYGPQAQSYEIPAAAPHVFYVAPAAKPDGAGNTLEQPVSIDI